MKRYVTIAAILGTFLCVSFNPDRPYQLTYIDTFCVTAVKEMHKTGIPASIILAQAIVESNCGQSKLARMSNNHFGIKCKSYWEGMKYYHKDDDRDAQGRLIPSCFRSYDNVLSSYTDHSEFLTNSPNYEDLFYIHRTDYVSWAYGLSKAGYATDKTYAEKLIKTVERFNLSRFDRVKLKEKDSK